MRITRIPRGVVAGRVMAALGAMAPPALAAGDARQADGGRTCQVRWDLHDAGKAD